MVYRIADLEKELALCTTNSSQREKVAENVEYIRVWRQMKQLNDKLITAQEKNVILTTEINDLKTTLEQTTRYNHCLSLNPFKIYDILANLSFNIQGILVLHTFFSIQYMLLN